MKTPEHIAALVEHDRAYMALQKITWPITVGLDKLAGALQRVENAYNAVKVFEVEA